MTVVFVLLLAGMFVVLFWAWYVSRRKEQSRQFDCHDHLFLELARAHRLSRTERQLLRRLAVCLAVHADLFFVRSDLFIAALEKIGDADPHLNEEVKKLRRRLHTVAPKDEEAAPTTAAGTATVGKGKTR